MSEFEISAVYKFVTLLTGFGVVYMGYRLFRTGVFEKAGELKAAWGERNLELKQAAPGTFFAVLGAIVLMIAVNKGISFESSGPTQGFNLSTQHTGPGSNINNAANLVQLAVEGEPLNKDEKQQVLDWLNSTEVRAQTVIFDDPSNRTTALPEQGENEGSP